MAERRKVAVWAAAVLGLGVATMAVPAIVPEANAGPGDGPLTLQVIRDVNGNGGYDPAFELGVTGMPVTVTDPTGATATGVTGDDGRAMVDLTGVSGGRYRVEVRIPEDRSYLSPAPAHGDLSSLTEFVDVADGKAVTVTMGVWNPADYAEDNPKVAMPVHRATLWQDGSSKEDPTSRSIVTFDYTATGVKSTVAQIAAQGDTAVVTGLAYDRVTERLFSAAFAKRLTEYGTGGPGGIYVTDVAGGATSLWATVPDAGTTAHDTSANQDGVFFAATGKESLGDIELSEDYSELYVVNLNNKSLYTFDATAGPGGAPTSSVVIPDPGCPSPDDWRPGALGVRDGVVYVGGVCSGQSTQALADTRAVVHTYDPASGVIGGPIVNEPLDFPRGVVSLFNVPEQRSWQPWTDTWGDLPLRPEPEASGYPTPLMTDIAVEANGDLVLGFRDRTADQVGDGAIAPDGSTPDSTIFKIDSGGDINRVCRQGDGSYAWEGSAANCPNHATPENSGDQPPDVIEYYPGEHFRAGEPDGRGFHDETAQGGLVIHYGQPNLLTTAMDPLDVNTAGVLQLDRAEGTRTDGLEVASTSDSDSWRKANGLGDLELLAEPAPLQLGNRVWFDADRDGVQDGDEPPVPGVVVRLRPCGSAEVLAETTTDGAGEYYFGIADGVVLNRDTCYDLDFDASAADTSALPGAPAPDSLSWTVRAAPDNASADSDVDPATGTIAGIETGGPGWTDHTFDAGLIERVGAVGDCVWFDQNRNGVQDPGEGPVAGVDMVLFDPDGAELGRTTTDESACTATEDGNYLFDNLALHLPYQVCVDADTLPDGYGLTGLNVGDDALDSDFEQSTGCAEPVTPDATDPVDLTVDAGLVEQVHSLGDCVWVDADGDGVQDVGEVPVSGVTVVLRDGDGGEVARTQTDGTDCSAGESGNYEFADLAPGAYEVCVDLATLPEGAVLTVQNAGGDTAVDSNMDPATGCAEPVTLGPDNPDDPTIDAGLVEQVLHSLGDCVWVDADGDGVQDVGEVPVSGVTMVLRDGDGGEVARTQTDGTDCSAGESGNYEFAELAPGVYEVCVDMASLPEGTVLTSPNAGGDTAVDSNMDPATGCAEPVTLGPDNPVDLTIDAGLVEQVLHSLGDCVWVDADGDGVQDVGEVPVSGVTMVLRDADGGEVARTQTDGTDCSAGESGNYEFAELAPGVYEVCVDMASLPEGTVLTTQNAGGDTAVDSNMDPATGCAEPVTLGPDNPDDPTIDAGLVEQVLHSLGDCVWVDADGDGVQDVGEVPVSGVTMVLRDADGGEVARTQTDGTDCSAGESGNYEFAELAPGVYEVCVDMASLPEGAVLTVQNAGGDTAVDSNMDPATGCAEPVTLGPDNPDDPTIDAGIISGVIGDCVWWDADGDGVQDAGERSVAGVTLVLKDADGMTLATTQSSDRDCAAIGPDDEPGNYWFVVAPTGAYQVCVDTATLPEGSMLTQRRAGADTAADSDAAGDGCAEPVTLSREQRSNLTIDFGLKSTPDDGSGGPGPGNPDDGGLAVTGAPLIGLVGLTAGLLAIGGWLLWLGHARNRARRHPGADES